MKTIYLIIFSILLFILFAFFSDSYSYNPVIFMIICIVYFLFIFIIKKKYPKKRFIPIITISAIFLSVLFFRLLQENNVQFKISDFGFLIFFIILDLLSNGIFKQKTINFLLLLLFSSLFSFYINIFMFNKLTFGTYGGNFKQNIYNDLIIKNSRLEKYKLNKDKLYVIDLWNKNCGVCIKKFPKFEKFRNKYKNKNNIEFIALNIYSNENDILFSENTYIKNIYSFKSLYISKFDATELNTKLFPTTIIIKDNKIIFKGNLETLSALSFMYIK